jgi:hypothetical protein
MKRKRSHRIIPVTFAMEHVNQNNTSKKNLIRYYFQHYFPHFSRETPEHQFNAFVDKYFLRKLNLTQHAFSRKTYASFSETVHYLFTTLALIFFRQRIPNDITYVVMEYLIPEPVSPAEYHYITGNPTLTAVVNPLNYLFFNKLETILWYWVSNSKRFERAWSSGWRQKMHREIGPDWKKKPLDLLQNTMHHYCNVGFRKYGKYEFNIVVEALVDTMGEEETLERLYRLWNQFPDLTPIHSMILKVKLREDFCFSSVYSETFNRYKMF